ncbi:hypothetical protein QP948_03885, partial [Corynebacterium bovis]|uniref:hypothetical protein n=1 Tax=Corynebacterium bovis TaxID=36808 RepID=UPI00254D117C
GTAAAAGAATGTGGGLVDSYGNPVPVSYDQAATVQAQARPTLWGLPATGVLIGGAILLVGFTAIIVWTVSGAVRDRAFRAGALAAAGHPDAVDDPDAGDTVDADGAVVPGAAR